MAEPARAEVCENCGAAIGKLETSHLWQSHVVCGTCYVKLANPPSPPGAAPRFNKPPSTLKVMFYIGLALWFLPVFLAISAGSSNDGFVPIEWLGAILAIGSFVAWAIIIAAKSTG